MYQLLNVQCIEHHTSHQYKQPHKTALPTTQQTQTSTHVVPHGMWSMAGVWTKSDTSLTGVIVLSWRRLWSLCLYGSRITSHRSFTLTLTLKLWRRVAVSTASSHVVSLWHMSQTDIHSGWVFLCRAPVRRWLDVLEGRTVHGHRHVFARRRTTCNVQMLTVGLRITPN